jgi:hypothetical protein
VLMNTLPGSDQAMYLLLRCFRRKKGCCRALEHHFCRQKHTCKLAPVRGAYRSHQYSERSSVSGRGGKGEA